MQKRDLISNVLPGEDKVNRRAVLALDENRRGVRKLWPFLGPAFIAAIAYVDPGNFATNMSSGAQFGFLLLWVILAANLMAMLIQTLSAKLGVASGLNLAQACRQEFSKPVRLFLWLVAEIVAMATDLAEFIGASLAMYLLFDIPLMWAALITACISFAILALQNRGFRPLEAAITGLMGLIVAGFAYQILLAPPEIEGAVRGLLIPGFDGTESILLACGILGATVMPHVIYLHSALTQKRIVGKTEREKQKIMRYEKIDVVIAMTIAGLVNMSMLMIAATVFSGMANIETLEQVYQGLGIYLGNHADIAFGIALLASGVSSSSVGTMAGQVVMEGFLKIEISLFIRRMVTMLPAIVIIALGVNPTWALIISQVVLSFGIPFALVPLILFTKNERLMGSLVNKRWVTGLASIVASLIIALNVFLLYSTFS